MNLAQVARVLAGFVLFFSLSQSACLAVAIWGDRAAPAGMHPLGGFIAGVGIGLLIALLLWFAGRSQRREFFRKEGIAAVGFAWCLAGVLGALPFLWSGALGTGADALFESISGLTTTGASTFGAHNGYPVEELPRSILLWRAMLQWMGGLGIILVFIVLLPAMGVTGKNLLISEQVGVAQEGFTPRMHDQARLLFRIYLLLTAAETGLLVLCDVPPFDAVCHAFTTMATGGFSTRNASIGAYGSVWVELVVILFMFLAGCNFTLLASTLRSRCGVPVPLLRNPEFRTYLYVTLGLVALMTAILFLWGRGVRDPALGITHEYAGVLRCLRDAAFQVVSILTSTGYSSADFQLWPKPALVLLFLCMLVGGCTGSTAGGFKVLRLIVSVKLVAYSLRRFLRPKSVEKLKVGQDVIPDGLVSAILALVLVWMASVAIGTLALSLDPRLDLLSAASASASMMGCTGPAMTSVEWQGASAVIANVGGLNLGPYGSYGDLHGWSKILMCVQMVLGRLEVFAPLVLLAPSFWRR